jgi:hypothetical protein
MAYRTNNQAALDAQYEVVWHGGMVDGHGTRGGLLPPYESTSSWALVEEALQTRWEFAKRLQAVARGVLDATAG